MKVAYFDCFSGIAGDMILGALLDLGVDVHVFKKELKKLSLTGYDIKVQQVECNHIAATDVEVIVKKEKQCHRNLADITAIIDRSTLEWNVKNKSKDIFRNLARVESKVHRTSIQDVHFHEVGAVDAIVDIVGSVIGLTYLGVEKIYCSPLPLGHGFVTCDHGILPLPAPATMELLKGVPVYSVDRTQELVTPTGAAIITTLADHFGDIPLMKVDRIGYGSGKIQSQYPNLLRVFVGDLQKKKIVQKRRGKKKIIY